MTSFTNRLAKILAALTLEVSICQLWAWVDSNYTWIDNFDAAGWQSSRSKLIVRATELPGR